jgi:hypothetical protein
VNGSAFGFIEINNSRRKKKRSEGRKRRKAAAGTRRGRNKEPYGVNVTPHHEGNIPPPLVPLQALFTLLSCIFSVTVSSGAASDPDLNFVLREKREHVKSVRCGNG